MVLHNALKHFFMRNRKIVSITDAIEMLRVAISMLLYTLCVSSPTFGVTFLCSVTSTLFFGIISLSVASSLLTCLFCENQL